MHASCLKTSRFSPAMDVRSCPVMERHAGQDDERLEPRSDLSMGIDDRSPIGLRAAW